jgi:hypothetical protein
MRDIMSPRSSADVPISDLSHLYTEPDPRAYYAALGALDYRTPDYVQQLSQWCLHHKKPIADSPWIIDVGCGYGVNGAGLLYGVPAHELLHRYETPEMMAFPSEDTIEQDAVFFASHARNVCRVAGVDVSRPSLDYGLRVGLLDAAFDDDLIEANPPDDLIHILPSTALIIESGVPIFIAPHVFSALLAVSGADSRPWVITAPPRYTNVSIYEDMLAGHGYTMTRVSDAPLPHRRFNAADESTRIIAQQNDMGMDSTIEAETGYIHVDLYLARPREDAEQSIDFKPVVQALDHQ